MPTNSNKDADEAEFYQAVMALYIPLSLFIACLISAAGIFLIYNTYALGWLFVAIGITIIVSAFIAFFRFQNKLRLQGHFKEND